MRLSRLHRTHRDWLITIIIAALIAALAITLVTLLNGDRQSPSQDSIRFKEYPGSSEVQPIVPPDPKFPPPSKQQRGFYQTYTEGDVQYSVVWKNRNLPRNPAIGPHTFTITLYNSRNANIEVQDTGRITIGCVAMDGPYRTVSVESEPISFAPYEKRVQELSVDVNCMYLGTADGSYFWRTY